MWLYSKAGYRIEYIMALSGHATEDMLKHYADGHEKKKPVLVQAGLSLTQVKLSDIDWETDLSGDLKKLAESDK